MRRSALVLSVVLVCLASGCSIKRQGALLAVPRGVDIPVQVELAGEEATVTGVHPETGEVIQGRLERDTEADANRPPRISVPGESAASPGAMPPSMQATGAGPAVLNLVGNLWGDQGTKLRCSLQVEKRALIRGQGLCRDPDADDDAPFYRLSF